MNGSPLERYFLFLLRVWKLDRQFVREYRFDPTRYWKFDFADKQHMIAVEIEGGVFSQGRHTRGKGFVNDCEKYNAATIQGWRVVRFATKEQMSTFDRDYEELKLAQRGYHATNN